MKKIFVVGPAGSGKSTLAHELAEKIGGHYLELDAVNHQANWQAIDKDEFRSVVRDMMRKDAWVIDGNYLSTIGKEAWAQADAVVWLNYPLIVVLPRLIRRTLRRTIRQEELWNGNKESFFGNFFTKNSVIYFMISKWKSQKQKYSALFNEPDSLLGVELVRLRRYRDVRAFLERF